MNSLSDSAKKKRDLLSKTSDDASEFKWGFDAGYEVGREEMEKQCDQYIDSRDEIDTIFGKATMSTLRNFKLQIESIESQVKLCEEALKFYAQMEHWGTDMPGMRTAIDPSDQCFGLNYADIRGGKRAKKALESLSQLRGGEK